MRTKLLAVVGIAATMLTLTACSTAGANKTPSPTPVVTATPSTPTEALTALAAIADASCTKAMAEGTVQTSGGMTLVMIPKDQAIDGFSAAYGSPDGSADLIYEADAFYACALSNQISLAKDGGKTIDDLALADDGIKVTYIDGTNWKVVSSVGSDESGPVMAEEVYVTKGGLITQVTYKDPDFKSETVSDVRYGNITDAELGILKKAVKALNG